MAIRWFKKKETEESKPPSSPDDEGRSSAPAEEEDSSSSAPASAIEAENAPPPVESDAGNAEKKSFFGKLRNGLRKTRKILTADIDDLFLGKKELDEELLEELEERLITADLGVDTTMTLIERISKRGREISGAQDLREAIREELQSLIEETPAASPPSPESRPHVVLVLGVNGVGKTTTIGKLAARASSEGKRVLIAAADTFRAAAIEQLEIWAERAGADFVRHKDGADPAAVAFDGIEAALARDIDLVLIDTAGRLHTKTNLMEELKKIKRSIAKRLSGAPHETLLVLDATTGQNALSQATLFHEHLGITGMVMTKLDGTAKGGVVVSVCRSIKVPLCYVGVGEQIEDLQAFDPEQFVKALI